MNILSFEPKKITKILMGVLPERSYSVIINRYGLSKDNKKMTLEAIGNGYGITRERVRQIENHALDKIKQSDLIIKEQSIFNEMSTLLNSMGVVIQEDDLFNILSLNKEDRNHVYFLLTLGNDFVKEKESNNFKHRWHVDMSLSKKVLEALTKLEKQISVDDIVQEDDILKSFSKFLNDLPKKYTNDKDVLRRWLNISKDIGKNSLGDWGLASSNNINVKGMRDYAYLILRQHGSPIHFAEVSKKIAELFGKKAHIATCHNELIKDDRFVLVGRGLYALKEWGYMTGVVRDVIYQILKENGPLTKDEIVKKVMKERYVKDNTVVVNLQNTKYFKRTKGGKYSIV